MLAQIKQALAPPIFQDEEQTRVARLLNGISLAILVMFIGAAIVTPFTTETPQPPMQAAAFGALVQLGVLILLRRRHIRLANWALCAALWVIVTVVSALFGGIGGPVAAAYGIVILVAGLLLGRRAGVIFAALSVAGATAILYDELFHAVPFSISTVTLTSAWVAQFAILTTTTLLLYLALGNLNDALARARRNERAQTATNRELSAVRAMLEQRVAELERVQQQARDSETVYTALVESLPLCIFRKDLEGRFTLANQRFCEDMGKSRAEILGKTDFDLHPRALAEQYRADDQQICARGAVFETVEEHQVLGGDPLYAQVIKTPTYDANGNLTGIQGIFWDVTARERAEKVLQQSHAELEKLVAARTAELAQERNLLRESENRLRTIIEGTQALLVSVDARGRFTYANDATAKVVGYATATELIGKSYLQFVHPEDRKGTLDAYLHQIRTRQPSTFREFRIIDAAGNVKWFSFLANLVIQDGQAVGQTGVAQDITERKRAEQELQRRANEITALYETTRDLATQQDLPTLLRSIAERAAALLAVPGGAIYLYDATRGDLEVALTTNAIVPTGTRVNLGEGMAGRVAQARQPLIVNDYSAWPQRSPQYKGVPFSSVIEVPMLYGGELIGVLAVYETDRKTRTFTDADARLLSLFAGQAASAVRAARLFEEAQRRAHTMQRLYELGAGLSSSLDIETVLQHLTDAARELCNATYTRVNAQLEPGGMCRRSVSTIHPEGVSGAAQLPPRPGGLTETVIRTGQPLVIPDLQTDPRANPRTRARGIRTQVGFPIKIGSRTIGALFANSVQPNAFSQQDQELLSFLATQAGISIQNAQLFEDSRQRAQRQEALYRVSTTLARVRGARELCQAVARAGGDILGYPYLGIFLIDPATGDRVLQAQAGWDDAPENWRLHPGEGLSEQATLTGELQYCPDVTREPRYAPGMRGSRSEVDVPIRIGDAVRGVLDATVNFISFPVYFINGERRFNIASRPFGNGLTEQVIRSQAPVWIPEGMPAEMAKRGIAVIGTPARCYLAVPMIVGDKVLGVIAVQDYEKENVYQANKLALLSTIAAQAAIALENARLFAAQQLQATRLQIAAEVARVATSLLDIDQVLPRVAELIRDRFGYYHVGISLTAESGEWIVLRASCSETIGHELEKSLRFRVGKEGMIGVVAGSGQPRVAQDVTADAAYVSNSLLPETRAEVVLPLKIGETVFGVLDVESKAVNAFPPDAVSILTTIADQIAIAIQNARLHHDEKQRAQELEQAYHTLQQNQAQLLIAEKMASLGRLTAGIAHEMNTPLAAVRAALAEIEKLAAEYQSSIGDADVTPDDHRGIAAEMQQSLRLAGSAAERAASFVRGIKTQTRDLAAHESQRFNAVPVIRETLLLLGHTLRASKCKADFEPAVEKVELDGSPGRLAQVITNLVTNAVDACAAKGGGAITVGLTPRANEVELQVSDTGAGIPPEILPNIFDPMFTTKPFGQGTGLGLAIVHDIITGEFGGTIQVASEIDQGATFTLHFPKSKEN